MSQLSSAIDQLKATGDVGAFATTLASDLVKDFQIISALPGVKAFEDGLAAVLVNEVSKAGFSPTLAALVARAIQDAL
ncbi:MAG TPA: hypothetical protein VN805_08250 [Caulobacteraceae bacterium]|nr:hypothetical protein [Caulobacteraceae bacterium]